jgi:osmotically-inducible protein OsmY
MDLKNKEILMQQFFEKSDSQIQKDVLNELQSDPSVTSSEINVTTNQGIVTLRGSVPAYFEKSSAENAAQRVSGVRAVADEIEVNIMGSYQRSDEQIADAAGNALTWSASAPKNIKVSVEKGWITLKGETEWDFQRNAAKDAVSQLMGVKGVHNKISLQTQIMPADIKNRIEEALKRSAESDSLKIKVDVEGEEVTLSGEVHSLSEISDARFAAWMAPGVSAVVSHIKIAH